MAKYISILRGINVGGNRKILMADLKTLFEKIGFWDVQTYIQSGNVIFNAKNVQTNTEIGEVIQLAISERYGFDVPVIIRTAEEMVVSIANNPFWKEKESDINWLHLTF